MMEHIGQHDWYTPYETNFINEEDLNDCIMERILQNKFYDPMASSESEDEAKIEVNWDEVFIKNRDDNRVQRVYVPVLHPCPPYPRLSTLDSKQHYQCLKVLCSQKQILTDFFIPRPTKGDFKVFHEVSELYEKEKKEYIAWAKTLWVNGQSTRALRPKPGIEAVYAAEFNMRAQEMKSLPKTYSMVAQIPLSMRSGNFELSHQKELIRVKTKDIPQIEYPEDIKKRFTILRPASTPEPCSKHLCRFILPGDNSMTILPLAEMHRELANYAADNGSEFVASEAALRAIVDTSRSWTLPVSVCETIGPDGDKLNVIVLGSDCPIEKEPAQTRTYRAFRHLLEYALIPPEEKARVLDKIERSRKESEHVEENNFFDKMGDSSDEDADDLVIDTGEMDAQSDTQEKNESELEDVENSETEKKAQENNQFPIKKMDIDSENIGIYSCTCKDTMFERPPPRSFRKWKVNNGADNEKYNIIVHCPHKAKYCNAEVILEPVVEYQLDLGASEMEQSRIDSLSLSLMLHKQASLLKARVEGSSGEVVSFELISPEHWKQENPESLTRALERVTSALSQLRTLLPATYLLHHKPSHGENAILYAARAGAGAGGRAADKLALSFETALQANIDEAKALSVPPTLSCALLPYHKYRKILPCAFTPFEQQVAKESKKPAKKQKTPPQAIAWPKRRNKKKRLNKKN